MTRPAPKRDIPSDFTSQISALKLEDPCESGAFGDVYQRTINTSEGTTEVAVKVFKIDSRRPVEKYEKAMRRELNVWLKLSKHPTIVPILGIAHVGFQLPVLVSQWMPSGTLYKYLERGTIRTASEKVELAKGVADGLTYLHSENVVHGDLHPGNVLIDGSGNPCLADFGLATVVGEPELQWGATTAACELNARWHAPEVIGFGQEDGPARPDFKSDIYSFGGVMFFIVSGDIPWKEKKHSHIIIALSKNVEHPRPDSILNKHWNLIQKCWCWDPWDRPKAVEVLRSLHITGLVIEDDTLTDFTSQNFDVSRPCAYGSFSSVCRCTIQTGEGTTEVAVKVLVIDPRRSQEKLESSLRRELVVWLKLSKSPYIVPLLGVAKFDSPLPALVSEWMPSGTLSQYLEKHAATITPSARVELAKGVAGGVNYLRSESVVHGALHPGDVLIDSSGNPRLTDFGLATVVGDQELQWTTTTAACNFNSRWRAPEVIGIERDKPERPTFESDIYSLGSVIFFIISGDIPWKEKNSSDQISIELAKKATPTRSENIPNGLWNLIQKCWSWEPKHRPEAEKVLEYANLSGIDDLQASISNQPVDLTGQIIGQINDFVAGGTFANVYRCECKQASGRIKVAVKVIKFSVSKEELERFHHETKIWAVLEHDHIIRLLGTARGLGPFQAPALIFPWVETTLSGVIEKEGAKLNIRSKLELLIGTVSALEHLHGLGIVHGDVTSLNVLVDILDGRYRACLADVGLATILGGRLGNRTIQGLHVRLDVVRWIAPELLNGGSPTKENDMYSFGCVMFHLLTLYTPWYTITHDFAVVEHIRRGEQMSRPASSDSPDLTDVRWSMILECWSAMASASMAIDFLKSELEALSGDNKTICGERREHDVYPIQHEDRPSPATSDSFPHITNARCDEIQQCLPVDASASEVADLSEASGASIDDRTTRFREERGHRQAYSDRFDADDAEIMATSTIQSSSRTSPSQLTRHIFSSVSTLSLSKPFNVLIFGGTVVDKSSVINLILGQDAAQTSPNQGIPTFTHTPYEVSLGTHCFKLWEVSSIESMGFFQTLFWKWRLKKSYKRLCKDDGVYLLLYCMRGSMAERALIRDYKSFTDIVGSTAGPGHIPVAAVVTSLEDYPRDMNNWWRYNRDNLERLGMRFSAHACITSLPVDPNASDAMRARRQRSEDVIRSLIHESYQAGSTPVSSNITPAS